MLTQDDFVSYPSVENDYHEETLKRFCEKNPEYEKQPFCIQEKIHGTNTQINFTPNGEITIGSRKRMLVGDFNNCGVRSILEDPEVNKDYVDWFEKIKGLSKWLNKKVTVFGEWFGPKICKGVNYGEKKRFRWFDIAIDNVIKPISEVYTNAGAVFTGKFMIPIVAYKLTLKEALKIKTGFISLLSEAGSIAEGIVIKPYYKLFLMDDGKPFFIKKKDPKFLEVSKAPKLLKDRSNRDNERILVKYVTETRVENMMSKEGAIKNKTEIGKYIKLIQTDIVADFKKTIADYELQPYQISYIAKLIVPLLRKYL